MGGSSRRVGPTYDTLVATIQPWPDRTTFSVIRLHHDGPTTSRVRESSGVLAVSTADLETVTALGLLERLTAAMRSPAQRPAPPLGDMGEQLSLDLDLRH